MRKIRTELDIAASAERLWSILLDFRSYPDWNPFIRSISGTAVKGERLTAVIAPPGSKPMTFRPRILVADTGSELRWIGKLLVPGLFDGEHHFCIEQRAGGVRFHHGEDFSGLFVRLMPASSFENIEKGFHAMNAALKVRAEQ